MNGCRKKMLNLSWHQNKLGGSVFYKVKFRWGRVRATKKDEDEEKKEKGCRKILVELLLGGKRSSMGLFYVIKVCGLKLL
jgi:hypothetical protein